MLPVRAILFAVLTGCSGCIPWHLQETPHVTGGVLDAQTQQPLVGARLYYERYPKHVVETSTDGQFDFPAISTWQLVPLGPYDRFYSQHLIAEASGYESAQRDFGLWGEATNQIFLLRHK